MSVPKQHEQVSCDEVRSHFHEHLREQLECPLEVFVQEHLSHCEMCCQVLEQMAGGVSHWQAVRDAGLDEASDSVVDDQNLLSPSDDPAFLGRIGQLEIIGLIGRGGMGIVYKAHDRSLDRTVAVKILDPTLGHIERCRHRFAREARAMAAVSHPHEVPIHAVDQHGRLPYLVMEYVPGGTLAKRIQAAPYADEQETLDVLAVLRVGLQVASALDAAHSQGLVHRDVKPSNLLLDPGIEKIRVADFGLAQVADGTTRTLSGTFVGTPAYMSPEQFRGDQVDGRSDLFSLGCVLYEMLTGQRAFHAMTLPETMRLVLESTPPRPSQMTSSETDLTSSIPAWLDALVMRLLAKDPGNRFESAAEVERVLQDELIYMQSDGHQSQDEGIRTLPDRAWAIGFDSQVERVSKPLWRRFVRAALLCLLVVGAMAWWTWPRETSQVTQVAGDGEVDAAPEVVQMPSGLSPSEMVELSSLTPDERAVADQLITANSHKLIAFSLNRRLLSLSPDAAWRVTLAVWPRLTDPGAKTGLLKTFQFATHPHVIRVLDLGMTDPEPYVREYASSYLKRIALADYSTDPSAYTKWFQWAKDVTPQVRFEKGYKDLVSRLSALPTADAIAFYDSIDDDMGATGRKSSFQAKRQAAAESGLHELLLTWQTDPELNGNQRHDVLGWIANMSPTDLMLESRLRPLLKTSSDPDLRLALTRAIERAVTGQPDGQPTMENESIKSEYLGQLRDTVRKLSDSDAQVQMKAEVRLSMLMLAMMQNTSAEMVPDLIAIMDSDNSRETITAIKIVLGEVVMPDLSLRPGLADRSSTEKSLVKIDVPLHQTDGPWWRRWWLLNRHRFGEPLASRVVPDFPKTEYGRQYKSLPENIGTYDAAARMILDEMKKQQPDYDVIGQAAFGVFDPRLIPLLIGVIDSDNSYDTVYGLGYHALGYKQLRTLTQVRYNSYHDGAWWRRWWHINRERKLTEAGMALVDDPGIPDFPKSVHGQGYLPFPSDLDTHEGRVAYVREHWGDKNVEMLSLLELISNCDDPRGIPVLLGMMKSFESKAGFSPGPQAAYYLIASRGLCSNEMKKLTKVKLNYSKPQDLAWWEAWWERSRDNFPLAKDEPIPIFGR